MCILNTIMSILNLNTSVEAKKNEKKKKSKKQASQLSHNFKH